MARVSEGSFLGLFDVEKPVMGMLHLKGETDGTVLERVKREADIYAAGGVDAVIVENYFGTYDSMLTALEYLRDQGPEIPFGVNCLNVDAIGFDLARNFGASFVQLDSVVGHVKPRDESAFAAFLAKERPSFNGFVLGGVRFKYQPCLSENTVEEDLAIARDRCDGVVVTQDATGQETSIEKIERFRAGLGEGFPLVVGAGVTPANARESLAVADAAIVGSFFKDTYKDEGDVDASHVAELMAEVRRIRAAL